MRSALGTMSDEDYSAHMNALMEKIGHVFDGQEAIDAAQVCARACAWAIYMATENDPERRTPMLMTMLKFIRDTLEGLEKDEGSGKLWTQ